MLETIFEEAKEIRENDPLSFLVPEITETEIDALGKDDFVMVSAYGNQFWVKVTSKCKSTVSGIVWHKPEDLKTDVHGLSNDDKVTFEYKHIYLILQRDA